MVEFGSDARAESRRLLEAILPVAADLSLPVVLHRIVTSARDLAGAKYGALGVLGEDRRLAEFITVGIDPDQVRRIGSLPEGHGILGMLIVQPKPIRLPDLTRHPDSFGFPPNHPPMHSFLGVPVLVRNEVYGNLYLTEKVGAAEFTDEDEQLVIGLAAAAGVAIDNARLHAKVRDLAVLEDRERIARDLHDTVIQRLYAAGMSLTGTLRAVTGTDAADRIQRVVDELDTTIRDIRSTIFALQSSDRTARGLRVDVLELVARSENSLGFIPSVSFDGLVDTAVSKGIGDNLIAALREALANVAKHARATKVRIQVAVAGNDVLLSVVDDGVGVPADVRDGGSGLRNLAERAAALGGERTVGPGPGGTGTELTWRVPLTS